MTPHQFVDDIIAALARLLGAVAATRGSANLLDGVGDTLTAYVIHDLAARGFTQEEIGSLIGFGVRTVRDLAKKRSTWTNEFDIDTVFMALAEAGDQGLRRKSLRSRFREAAAASPGRVARAGLPLTKAERRAADERMEAALDQLKRRELVACTGSDDLELFTLRGEHSMAPSARTVWFSLFERRPSTVEELSTRLDMPEALVEQLLGELVAQGYVRSTSGGDGERLYAWASVLHNDGSHQEELSCRNHILAMSQTVDQKLSLPRGGTVAFEMPTGFSTFYVDLWPGTERVPQLTQLRTDLMRSLRDQLTAEAAERTEGVSSTARLVFYFGQHLRSFTIEEDE